MRLFDKNDQPTGLGIAVVSIFFVFGVFCMTAAAVLLIKFGCAVSDLSYICVGIMVACIAVCLAVEVAAWIDRRGM